MTKIFTIILQETHKMWKARCKDRHRSGAGRRPLAEITDLDRELEQLCALEGKVLAWASRWRDVLKESAKASEEQATSSSHKIYTYMLGSGDIPFQRPPATRYERKQRRKQHQNHRTAPITERFKRVSKRKSASTAPAAVTTSRKTQQPLEAFFLPPGRIPPGPS